jgi:hypothetical protein
VVADCHCALGTIGTCFFWTPEGQLRLAALQYLRSGALSGLSGLITTFVNVYASHNGVLGVSSIATLAITGVCTVVFGSLAAFYWFWELKPVKPRH